VSVVSSAVDVHPDHMMAIGKSVGDRQENHPALLSEGVPMGEHRSAERKAGGGRMCEMRTQCECTSRSAPIDDVYTQQVPVSHLCWEFPRLFLPKISTPPFPTVR
jgi:hypothetical protein